MWEFCVNLSDKNINMSISFFDSSGNPIDFSKVTLDTSETLTNQVYESKKAAWEEVLLACLKEDQNESCRYYP